MKVTVEQINKYKVTIGGKIYDNFSSCSEWEGFIKFSGPDGVLILADEESHFTATLETIFGRKEKPKQVELKIVKASPSLLGA